MFQRREGRIDGFDNSKIYFQVWETPQPKGTLVIAHGQGEHSESYHRVVEALDGAGYSIFASDMRGHGRSDGKRGYASNFEDYCRDYSIFIEKVLNDFQLSSGPVVVLGHSMGALVQIKFLIDHPELVEKRKITAQVCSSPLLGVAVPVPAWKERAAELLNQLLPTTTLWNELTNDMLSRDPEVVREFEQDVLRHSRMSPGVYLGFKETMATVQLRASELKIPTFFQVPEEDPVVSTPEAKVFFDHLGSQNKKLVTYGDGARHEIYNDTVREIVLKDLRSYLETLLKEEQ